MSDNIFNSIKLGSKVLEFSESSDGTKKLGKILICPLDEKNKNGKGIKKDDITDEELSSLVGQPIVCKVIKDESEVGDFGGHELKYYVKFNPSTMKVEKKYYFDTSPIGYFTKVYIEEIEIDGVLKHCIVAEFELWKRYEQAIEVAEKLFSKGELHTSWELLYGESYESDGISWLKLLTFIGVALLGSNVTPAYKDSEVLELSALNEDDYRLMVAQFEETELALAQAFTNDLATTSNIEDANKNNKTGGKVNMGEDKNKALASLTDNDLYTKVRRAINAVDESKYFYISYLFPLEYRAIAHTWEHADTEFTEFKYQVSSDETVSIVSQKDVKMKFVEVEVIETEIAEKDEKIKELETELSTKVDEIVKLGEQVVSKETEIAELQPFKEKVEAIEEETRQAEIAEEKEQLKELATKSGYITQEELETPEIAELIENLDEKAIKVMIAERVVAKVEQDMSADKEKNLTVETSSAKEKPVPKVNLKVDENIESNINPIDVMSSYLKKQ